MDHGPRPRNRLTPAADLLPGGLGSIGGDLGRVVGAWPAIVGDKLARVTTPSRLREGVLHVRCASASWAQALLGTELQVMDRIAAQLGEGLVVRLTARAGGPAPRVEVNPAPAPLPDLTADQHAAMDDLVATISDPELRARMRAAASATARRRAQRHER